MYVTFFILLSETDTQSFRLQKLELCFEKEPAEPGGIPKYVDLKELVYQLTKKAPTNLRFSAGTDLK